MFRRWGERAARNLVRKHRVRINRFKLARKMVVRESILADDAVQQAAERHAQSQAMSREEAMDLARRYLDEIIPSFSVLSYYKWGFWAARSLLRFFYDVRITPRTIPKEDTDNRDKVFVYVMNHRSNLDYVLVAYALAGKVAISYAVGEWARVWPLDTIFRSFGSYFVRRRYREELYHVVLERYVQRITAEGVAQGIFLEGGLSRDGRLAAPKLGLLDYIARSANDPSFNQEILFVPVGINYDRVLEDRALTREHLGLKAELSRFRRFRETASFVGKAAWRGLRGHREGFGIASVVFGEPLSLKDYLGTEASTGGIHALREPSFERRKPLLQRLATVLMERIGRLVPVTPVPFCTTLLTQTEQHRNGLDSEASRLAEAFLERGAGLATASEQLLSRGLSLLTARRLIQRTDGQVTPQPDAVAILQYYRNSLKQFEI